MSLIPKLGTILILLVSNSALQAHGLYAHAELRGKQLRIEAWFDDDTPADKAKVKIVSGDIVIREGLTDDKGVWTTETLTPGKYQIQVDAGAGHRRDIEFIMPAGAATQSAGPTKSEVNQQHWLGSVIGLLILAGLVILGKFFLRRGSA